MKKTTTMQFKSIWRTLAIIAFAMTISVSPPSNAAGKFFETVLSFFRGEDSKGKKFSKKEKEKIRSESALPPGVDKDTKKFIDEFCTDVTQAVINGHLDDYVVGRSKELRQMIKILNKGGSKTNKNIMIYGDSGSGKTTLVDKLAYIMAKHPEKLPPHLKGKRIIKLDNNTFTAGVGNRGDSQDRIKALTHFLTNNPNTILFIDEIQDLSPKDKNEFDYLKKMLGLLLGDAKGSDVPINVQVIGTTMTNTVETIMQKEGMGRRWTRLFFKNSNELESMEILEPELMKIQARHGVKIPLHILEHTITLAKEHILDLAAPGSVKEILWALGSDLEASRLLEPEALEQLGSKLKQQKLLLDSLKRKQGPYYRKKQLEISQEVESMQKKFDKLSSEWDKFAPEYRKSQEMIGKIHEYQAHLETALKGVGDEKLLDFENIRKTAKNLQILAERFPSEQMKDVDHFAKQLEKAQPNDASAVGQISELIELLDADIVTRREILNKKLPFQLFDEVTEEDVAQYIAEQTNKNIELVRLADPEKEVNGGLAGLVNRTLRKNIVEQEGAISALVDQIKSFQRGHLEEDMPLGHFLFLGPSRLGKTFIAKVLGSIFGDTGYLRVPMSDYKTKADVTRLTGASPGHVGYEDLVEFYDRVAKNPQLVICLDEFEKAHPDVVDFFLKFREQAIHKSPDGRQIDFSRVTFIYTTNALQEVDGNTIKRISDLPKRRTMLETLLRRDHPKMFSEAFLNGMTEIIRFDQFSERGKILVTDRIWDRLRSSIGKKANIDVQLSADAIEYLAKNSEGGNAAKVSQIIRKEVIAALRVLKYRRGDLIDVDINPNASIHDSPFSLTVRKDLRDMEGADMERVLAEREAHYNLDEVLARAPEEPPVDNLSLDEMDDAIRSEREATSPLAGATDEVDMQGFSSAIDALKRQGDEAAEAVPPDVAKYADDVSNGVPEETQPVLKKDD